MSTKDTRITKANFGRLVTGLFDALDGTTLLPAYSYQIDPLMPVDNTGNSGCAMMIAANGKIVMRGLTTTDMPGVQTTANLSTDVSADESSSTKYPSVKAIKDYADNLVIGLLDDRGNYDASTNLFPVPIIGPGGGSGINGAILKGDIWYISVAGTLGTKAVYVGNTVRALTNTPGQTAGNWSIMKYEYGYVPLNKAGDTMLGNLLFTDNTYDIGANGATRPRTAYFGTSVISPLFNGLTLTSAATGFTIAGGTSSRTFTMSEALTVNTGSVTLTGNVANTSVLTIGAGAVSVSGTNSGDNAPNSSTMYIGSTQVALNRGTGALVLTGITSIDGTAAKATNIVGGNSTTLLGSIPYQSNTDVTTLLSPNTTSTKKFLRQTGTGTNGAIPAWDTLVVGDVKWDNGGSASVPEIDAYVDHIGSSGLITGCTISKVGDGSVNITSGEWMLRDDDNEDAELRPYDIPAQNALFLTDKATSYIIITYANIGTATPYSVVPTISNIACNNTCVLAVCYRSGNNVDYMYLGDYSGNFSARYAKATSVTSWLQYGNGLQPTINNLGFSFTEGSLYQGVIRFAITATANPASFTYYYRSAIPNVWTEVASQTAISNTSFDDGDGTLGTLGNGDYGVHWIYLIVDNPNRLVVVYGQASYTSLASARAAAIPASLPPFCSQFSVGKLIGKAIVRKSAASLTEIGSPFTSVFTSGNPVNHNDLATIQLVGAGITYGHVSNGADSLYGTKTFYNDILKSGTVNLGATAERFTKGWFTDLESTNYPSINGTSIVAKYNIFTGIQKYITMAQTYSASKDFQLNFTAGLITDTIDIQLPNENRTFWIEIDLSGGFNTGNATGRLTKTISGRISSNVVYDVVENVTLSQGGLSSYIAIGTLVYETTGTTGKYAIPIGKVLENTNAINAKVRCMSATANLDAFVDGITISSKYTGVTPSKNILTLLANDFNIAVGKKYLINSVQIKSTDLSDVTSGVYTPTATGISNIESVTPKQCQYMRVGSVVTVSGIINIDLTASGVPTDFRITLPIASNIGVAEDVAGTGRAVSYVESFVIYGAPSTDTAYFLSRDISSAAITDVAFTFTYRII